MGVSCDDLLWAVRSSLLDVQQCWYTSFGTSLPSVVFALEHFLAEILALAGCSREAYVVGKDVP